MDARNCRMCGKMFNYISGRQICSNCKKDLEEKFAEVKEYVREHKDASIAEVSEELSVPVKQIKDWIREERLQFSAATGEICCENCGKPITTGKFCDNCRKKMVNKLDNAYQKPQVEIKRDRKTNPKMRFLDN